MEIKLMVILVNGNLRLSKLRLILKTQHYSKKTVIGVMNLQLITGQQKQVI